MYLICLNNFACGVPIQIIYHRIVCCVATNILTKFEVNLMIIFQVLALYVHNFIYLR